MAGQSQAGGNATDLFDVYFRRADLDGDGRISGSEAVSFFQGSNLSKNVLAQVWMHADQNRTGFLGRSEFYNALKLVTVAQSKRELTPDIVKAALYGPAAAKIPAPQINLAATPTLQSTPRAVAPTMQLSSAMPVASQSIIIGGPQVLANSSMNQQHVSYQQNQSIRPPQGMPSVSPKLGAANQGYPGGGSVAGLGPHNPSLSTDWFSGKTDNSPAGASSQIPNQGVNPPTSQDGFGIVASGLTPSVQHKSLATSGLTTPVAPKPQDPSYHVETKNSKTSMASGNGFVPDSVFGDVNSLSQSHPKQDGSGNFPLSSAMVPVSSGQQPLVRPNKPESTQSSITPYMHMGGQLQKAQPAGKQNQIAPGPTATKSTSAGNSLGGRNSSSQSQLPWPKTITSDIQKYTKVFMEVDIDRDGKISGEQARNLFLSWRLPREVLKQVWDLSDQDNDSMLSLREFCIALYLMERYREGRPLPAVLPSSVMYDETLLRTTGQPTASQGNEVWGASPGVPATRSTTPPAAVGPPSQILPPAESTMQSQQKSRVPLLEKHLVDQLSSEEQNSLNSKFQEATNADKKVEELEKEILDSRQNIECYSTKMQEIILYKSKCDNRLNEIIERTSGNKHEVDSLVRKYEERYKQVGDVASKLTIDEATFRDIQERKMDLYQAIIKMEQSEGADGGTLRINTDHIQSDLEELVKSLNERCKKYGLRAKPTTLVELPFGWQPGLQAGAADWDAEWDKLEDEGFTFVKELTLDVQNIVAPPKEKSSTVRKKANSAVDVFTSSSSLNADDKSEAIAVIVEQKPENGSANAGGRDNLEMSPPDSPAVGSILGSPSQEWQESHTPKSVGADGSPHVRGTQSDHGGSTVSGDKKFDEPSWGAFDTDYDTGSVWGFDRAGSKEADHGKFSENSFLDSGLVGLSPIKTSSLQVDDVFQSKRALAFAGSVPTTPAPNSNFADSVPSTPMHIFGNSPAHRGGTLEDHSFNHISRFDSFSINDGGFPARDSLSRFDSMRSTRDSEYVHGFTSFDDADPFGSSGLFKTSESQMHADTFGSAGFSNASFDSQTPKSTDADPFGSTATFKTSLDDQTQRRNYDNWNAF